MKPPVTYPVSLSDLMLVADAACEMDCYKDHLTGAERERVLALRDSLHDLAERAAELDAVLIYGPEDEAAA